MDDHLKDVGLRVGRRIFVKRGFFLRDVFCARSASLFRILKICKREKAFKVVDDAFLKVFFNDLFSHCLRETVHLVLRNLGWRRNWLICEKKRRIIQEQQESNLRIWF